MGAVAIAPIHPSHSGPPTMGTVFPDLPSASQGIPIGSMQHPIPLQQNTIPFRSLQHGETHSAQWSTGAASVAAPRMPFHSCGV